MDNRILGIHHITAIAGEAKRNHDFYTRVLGLRLVKKTVNFDDPGTYHFYYGDGAGSPGTILTFFPWEGARPGYTGTGMATEINYSVPPDSLDFWLSRFRERGVRHDAVAERFGEQLLSFTDPDGLKLNLVAPLQADARSPWVAGEIGKAEATRGFHSVVLTLKDIKATADILTGVFGYELISQEGNRYRFRTSAVDTANLVDLVEEPNGSRGLNSAGTNHHVAFRVKDEQVLMAFREKIAAMDINITGKVDRNYFFSLYFREPGGVLFEIATDNPGFAVDEPLSELGRNLKLPPQYESSRKQIEEILPVI
ncbi:MAG TPA: ring-cleaving dioxygenase [Flavisolibacter sp.]|nr:ring-cleaving dioxygenase [Flavisolibacter sp.]